MTESVGNKSIELVNVRKIFYNKNPKLARLLPGFFFRYLEKIVHQDDVNHILKNYGDKFGIEFIRKNIKDFNVTCNIKGLENIPKDGRYIIASNHPLGGFDALLLLNALDGHFKETKYLVNDILMNLKNLTPLFIPINKHGGQSKDAAIQLEETYKSDIQIATFPAGMVSRRDKGRIVDPVWHKNYISKAIKYQRDIIPVHITGRNTNRFYNLYSFRKLLGIKLNIEMLFLADETFRHKNKQINITFGKPISYKAFDKSKTYQEWAHEVKKIVYELGNDPL